MSDGDMMVGNYQLKNCVASGATTQIWECAEAGSPMQLAMKLMLEDARKEPTEKAVLKHEFKVGQSLEHPAFLRFHQLEINRDHAFFVMDFFRSPSLKTHLTSDLPSIQSSFPKLSIALAQAFQYMHANGWLHRDIKPDNILVNRAGEARVIDFSLSAKVKGKLGLMLSGKQKAIKGTRTYIAPETILRKPATEQTDMYSLGVTFYEVATGQAPFAGDTPNDLLKKHLGETVVAPSIFNPNVTKELDALIIKMLSKKPKDRYADMDEVARTLAKIKCFNEDPAALHLRKIQEDKDKAANSVDIRLDSRADAVRTEQGITTPVEARKKKKINPRLLREEEARKAAEAAKKQKGQTPQPMPQGYGMPMGMPYPGQVPMQYPGMPYPGQMPMQPGMPYPGQMPMQPGTPHPGMPGQPVPGQPVPGQPVPQQQQPSAPPAPAAQQPPSASPVPQPVPPSPPAVPQKAEAEEPTEMTLEDMMNIEIE